MNLAGLLVFEDSSQGSEAAARRFGGLSGLERGVRTMARAGVSRLLAVIPAGVDVRLGRVTRRLDLELEIVHWGSESHLTFTAGENVLVLLGDHVHHHSSLTAFVADGLAVSGSGAVSLVAQVAAAQGGAAHHAVVSGDGGLRFHAAPEGDPNPVSTGAFLCDGGLHPHELVAAGVPPLEFLSVRAAGRPVSTRPGDPALWRRAVDRRSARDAKRMLFGQVTKKTSGPVSRHINARMSIPISKVLIETGISPHMVTVLFVLTTGLGAAYLISHPEPYWRLALAGLLWQMAAVLDRCDGEIARVKLCESKFGAWFDTVTDNLAYFSFYGGILVGADRLHDGDPMYLALGLSAVVALAFALGLEYAYALRANSGSLQNYLFAFIDGVPAAEKGPVYRALEHYAFVAKRDFFSMIVFVVCVAWLFEILYWFGVVGLHAFAVGTLAMHRKMAAAHRRPEAHAVSPDSGREVPGVRSP